MPYSALPTCQPTVGCLVVILEMPALPKRTRTLVQSITLVETAGARSAGSSSPTPSAARFQDPDPT